MVAWGGYLPGVNNVPGDLHSVLGIAAGDQFNLVLRADFPPTAVSQSNTIYAGLDLLMQLAGSDRDGEPVTFRIVQLPSVGSLYQYGNRGRGTAILDPGTILTDPQHRLIYSAPPIPGLRNLQFVLNDGSMDSDPASVTLNVIPIPRPQISTFRKGQAVAQLDFLGIPNVSYSVWASTNLSNWTSLGAPSYLSNNLYRFIDSKGSNFPNRFYQLRSP